VIGVNHRNAAEVLRERLQGDEADVARLLGSAASRGLGQAIVVATRDRCEFWCVASDAEKARDAAIGALAEAADLTAGDLRPIVLDLRGASALRHVFAVVASLDGQVAGQAVALGQIKLLHELSRRLGMCGPDLDRVMESAYDAADKVGQMFAPVGHSGSMAASAVGVLRRLHGDVRELEALLIGDGDLGEAIHEQMSAIGLTRWTIAHPRERRAKAWAEQHRQHWRPFGELAEALVDADLVVAALDLGRASLSGAMIETALRKRRRRPMLLIDVAVPGDIDKAVDRLDDAYLFGLEDLERLASDATAVRPGNSRAAWATIDEAVARFEKDEPRSGALEALARYFEAERSQVLREAEIDASRATAKLIERLLQRPANALKSGAPELEEATRRLFGLNEREH
jgi:glutamyl-tRNA reductase